MSLQCWHLMMDPREEAPGDLTAAFRIPEDSPWFAGHFPGQPILPGVAMLAMVAEAIRWHAGRRRQKVRIAGLKRVRFKLPVKPNDDVTIQFSGDETGRMTSYVFQIRIREEIACTGVMLAEQTGAL